MTSREAVTERGQRVGVYCSDVAGAFDRVDASRLEAKLLALGINQKIVPIKIQAMHYRQPEDRFQPVFVHALPLIE